jgi:hypothetical protein
LLAIKEGHMKQHLLLLGVTAAAAALLVPTVFAGTPSGYGLYGEHWSHCSGVFDFDGYVTLVPGNGTSFWVADHQLVIRSADVTPTGSTTITYTFGQKTGQVSGNIESCEGDFPGYHVVSHDIVVP